MVIRSERSCDPPNRATAGTKLAWHSYPAVAFVACESPGQTSLVRTRVVAMRVILLHHKLQKPSNDAALERLKEWMFFAGNRRKSLHVLGLRLVYDAVIVCAHYV